MWAAGTEKQARTFLSQRQVAKVYGTLCQLCCACPPSLMCTALFDLPAFPSSHAHVRHPQSPRPPILLLIQLLSPILSPSRFILFQSSHPRILSSCLLLRASSCPRILPTFNLSFRLPNPLFHPSVLYPRQHSCSLPNTSPPYFVHYSPAFDPAVRWGGAPGLAPSTWHRSGVHEGSAH